VVSGDTRTLRRLLRAHPRLVHARSTREHGATLLHYASANGVEGYRQLSPTNSGEIAEMLLEAGADVNATADVYQGQCTALGLVATSGPPSAAGVQREVIDVLLKHGARMDLRGSVGHHGLRVQGCLANGQPGAAEYLASHGARSISRVRQAWGVLMTSGGSWLAPREKTLSRRSRSRVRTVAPLSSTVSCHTAASTSTRR
jgi:ankyrin repeat protein